MEKNFILSLQNEFCEENQINEQKIEINNESFSIFYIDSLINKTIFASSILSPIEKLKSEMSENVGSEKQNSQSASQSKNENTQSQEASNGESGSQNIQNSSTSKESEKQNSQNNSSTENESQVNLSSGDNGNHDIQDNSNGVDNSSRNTQNNFSSEGLNEQDNQINLSYGENNNQSNQNILSSSEYNLEQNSQTKNQNNGENSVSVECTNNNEQKNNKDTKTLGENNQDSKKQDNESEDESDLIEKVKKSVSVSGMVETEKLKEIKNYIFSGYVVIVFKTKALSYPLIGIEKRSVEEPPSSKVIKGPREGFVEDIATNNGLVRKRIKSSDLNIINIYVGERSKTLVSVYYLKDVAKKEIVDQVVKIIKSISIDAVIDSYYIVSYLEGDKVKFFKRVGNTEKPDIFCSKILEGRVGIMVDGSPIALTVPFILIEDLQSAGDYYSIPAFATFTRTMRFVGLIIAILIPGIYVALQSYNYRILPINFLITLLSSIEGLSIPPLLEILLVLFLFEIITEASVRMPNAMGMALSIIGALALGNTAVDAGIISPPSIVIVAISSVALHIIPDQFDQTRILRILFTTIGGIVGLYGIYVGVLFLVTYLCSVESFGIPYLAPYSPSIKRDKKDGFIMQPIQRMKYRPILMSGKDKIRQGKKR